MSPKYKFTYFDVEALGEPARFLLKYAGIDFEDYRVRHSEWPQLKSKTPFGQLPLLEVDGKVAHQSLAICRYLAKQAKLTGKDDWEDLVIDSIVDTINDLRTKIALYFYERDENIKASRKEPLFKEIIPFALQRLEAIAKENNGHLAFCRRTWADVYFAGILGHLNAMTKINVLDGYPNLQKVYDGVLEHPAIKEWVKSRGPSSAEFFFSL